MKAIFSREVSSYFNSLIGYIFLTAFFAASGVLFSITSLAYGSTDMSQMYSMLFFVLLVLIPILTMRTLAEDKRQKTDQCLLTAPVSLTALVMGKFFAAFLIYALGVCMTLVYAIIISFFGVVAWLEVLGTVVGLLLVGAAFIAVGILISSLTENQVIAAVGGFACMLALYLISSIAAIIPIDWIANILTKLSFSDRYYDFTYGIFDLSNVLFFLSATVIFIFLTIRVLERRRWS
ncbi:MAG: ABC transporter permease subunit [Oscillospiraceae bacterium]|nr:ABC transporter permease subunit [Oscillospiraceae bacterium]